MPTEPTADALYVGLMSGTSMDGVDGVLSVFEMREGFHHVRVLASAHINFSPAFRAELASLQTSGIDEIHREALAAGQLARCYADCVAQLLAARRLAAKKICAIGVHGQTLRHRPELGYTRQLNHPALLAELTGIDVIADFRSRDVAAGGQGAPLVPAFHQWLFGATNEQRVIANIGGISNISVLSATSDMAAPTIGYDTGPGNILLDYWIALHRGLPYDAAGAWGASGKVHAALLARMCDEAFFTLSPPKSTGRDLFNARWLAQCMAPFDTLDAADVQATLTELTAVTLAQGISAHAGTTRTVHVCGGGAFNTHLMARLQFALAAARHQMAVRSTAELGVPPDQVEALAFAWLARQFVLRQSGNLAAVTGASGPRILGALYPA